MPQLDFLCLQVNGDDAVLVQVLNIEAQNDATDCLSRKLVARTWMSWRVRIPLPLGMSLFLFLFGLGSALVFIDVDIQVGVVDGQLILPV